MCFGGGGGGQQSYYQPSQEELQAKSNADYAAAHATQFYRASAEAATPSAQRIDKSSDSATKVDSNTPAYQDYTNVGGG